MSLKDGVVPQAGLPPVKCLLVDDLDENLLVLSALLRREGVELLLARSGPEALELLLKNDDAALAFLDVHMPDMDGFELAELMRGSERTRHVPIIFVTAGEHDQRRIFKGYERRRQGPGLRLQGLRERRGRLPAQADRAAAARKQG